MPHAGGSASYYLPIAKAMAPEVDVISVQYPGRQDRRSERFVETVSEMADKLMVSLRPWLDRPVTLFGHSMGASVGYELALRLEEAGKPPTALFASARRAPHISADDGIYKLDDRGLIAEVKRLGGAGSVLLDDPDILDMVMPAIRNDYRAAETYRLTDGRRMTSPLFSFTGDADPKVTLDQARAWSEHTSGKFEFRAFPGDHFYIDTNTPAVIAEISAHIAEIRP
jgi:surfactin synthase thioesterase subunit